MNNDEVIRALRVAGGKCEGPNTFDMAADTLLEDDFRIGSLCDRLDRINLICYGEGSPETRIQLVKDESGGFAKVPVK